MREVLAVLVVTLALAGCDIAYKVATEERPVSVLVEDETITVKIKKRFFDVLPEALSLTVFCHQGRVVLL